MKYLLLTSYTLPFCVFVEKDLVERLGGSVFKLPEGEKLTVLDTFKGSEVVGIKYVLSPLSFFSHQKAANRLSK